MTLCRTGNMIFRIAGFTGFTICRTFRFQHFMLLSTEMTLHDISFIEVLNLLTVTESEIAAICDVDAS